MRKLTFLILVLALAGVVHVDWHLARPTHHRLSLGWSEHWLFAAAGFAVVGWLIARAWPLRAWRTTAWIVATALLLAQGLEPMLEVVFYDHAFGYPSDPGRWSAFGLCVAAGIPALALAIGVCRPRRQSTMAADSAK